MVVDAGAGVGAGAAGVDASAGVVDAGAGAGGAGAGVDAGAGVVKAGAGAGGAGAGVGNPGAGVVSAWKSSLGTAKRPGLDWTQTGQDRKFPRPLKTATAVQSSVSQDLGNFKTGERPVLTGFNQSFQ